MRPIPPQIPGPNEDSHDDDPRRPGVPTLADAVRLWRDAGARRHGETPRAILDSAIECLACIDVPEQAHLWITAARIVHQEGGLDDDTAHCVMWKVAAIAAGYSEDDDAAAGFLRRAGAGALARVIAEDRVAFEERMSVVEERMAEELRVARDWQDRGWAPPGVERMRAHHHVFVEALAATGPGSADSDAVTAGLLSLRFYDEYFTMGPGIASPDSPGMTNVRKALSRLPRDDGLRVALVRLVNRVQRTPQDGNEGAPGDLLAIAEAYRARGSILLAADVCHTVVQGWGDTDDGTLARPARRMLRDLEQGLAESRTGHRQSGKEGAAKDSKP